MSSTYERRRRFDQIEREALLQALENENLFRYLRENKSQVRAFERQFADTIESPHALREPTRRTAALPGQNATNRPPSVLE